ncbi:hypothetical protein TEA_024984 [Camellia sinensis var. sinensis]|uniref:Uncharacterized protein n=1 Tax=Camellia sinensis var. sinensis TaxID=542762 RepID=A0A4S4DG54_CAMSN|nr:hypothetical protein TEA_024984 [Camellia sinensis var. sinensis]
MRSLALFGSGVVLAFCCVCSVVLRLCFSFLVCWSLTNVVKKWVDKKSGYSSFMLYPRALAVAGGNENEYWAWKCFKDMSDDNVEVVKLITICWLDVQGKFEISELSPEVDYEIVFIVRLAKGCSGWELPNTLKLSLPNGQVRERHVCLYEEPKGQWLELNVGNFRTTKGDKGEVSFNFSNTGGHWKCGLLFKDVQGKFEISELSPEVDYEIVFIVRLAKGCSGWELPNTLKLSLPNGQVRERHVCLYEEPKGQWLELNVGNFRTTKGDKGEVSFNFSNTGGHWKCGLLFKGNGSRVVALTMVVMVVVVFVNVVIVVINGGNGCGSGDSGSKVVVVYSGCRSDSSSGGNDGGGVVVVAVTVLVATAVVLGVIRWWNG